MNCPFCGAKPMSVSGYECGTGRGAYRERSSRCHKAQVLNLKESIKRLEESGQEMAEFMGRDDLVYTRDFCKQLADEWAAAKEAKP